MPDPTGRISHIPEMHRGVAWKQPCLVATTGNITLSGTQTIDGVAVTAGKRVLVKNQTTGSQNGIWVCAAGAWTRAFDMDQDLTTSVPAEEVMGAFVYVIAGTTNGGTLWRNTNTSAPTLGTTALTFSQYASTSIALDDLTDVTITAPANANRLRYDGSGWANSNLVWEPMIASDGTVMTDGLLNPMQHEVPY